MTRRAHRASVARVPDQGHPYEGEAEQDRGEGQQDQPDCRKPGNGQAGPHTTGAGDDPQSSTTPIHDQPPLSRAPVRRKGSVQLNAIEPTGLAPDPRNWIAIESAMAVSLVAYLTLVIGSLRSSLVVVYVSIGVSAAAGIVLVIAALRGRPSANAGDPAAVATQSRAAPLPPTAPEGASRNWHPPLPAPAPISCRREVTEGCDTISIACTPQVVTAAPPPDRWPAAELAEELQAPGPGVMGRLRRGQVADVPARPEPRRSADDECSAPSPRTGTTAARNTKASPRRRARPMGPPGARPARKVASR